MDKFGIFNILSSLLNANQTEKPQTPTDFSPAKSAFSDSDKAAEKRAVFPPLQNSMLATMKNHDEFVKRVNSRTKKQ